MINGKGDKDRIGWSEEYAKRHDKIFGNNPKPPIGINTPTADELNKIITKALAKLRKELGFGVKEIH